jgi:uncharacterized protein
MVYALAKGSERGRNDRAPFASPPQVRLPHQPSIGTAAEIVPQAVAQDAGVAARIESQRRGHDFLEPVERRHLLHKFTNRQARRLRSDPPIDILVNNAGAALIGDFATADPAKMDELLRLNVVAPTLLASAVVGRMVERGSGAIINIASVLALLPEYSRGIYSATKSYLMTLSQGLAAEVTSKGVYVQAVLPAATRTEIYERAGGDTSKVPNVMEVEDLVDAALIGFDRKELVTIPPVPDVAAWEAFEKARGVLAAGFGNSRPAARYRA